MKAPAVAKVVFSRKMSLKFLVLCAIVALASAEVLLLDAEAFDEKTATATAGAFIKFYAPWCGHCQRLAPEFEKLADAYAHHSNILVAKVDCDVEKELCGRYSVRGYPTLKFFPNGNGKPEDYQGGRTAEDMGKFIQEKTGMRMKLAPNPVLELTSQTFDQIVLDPETHALIAFTAPWCGHCQRLKPEFTSAAKSFRAGDKVVLANVNADDQPALRDRYGITGFPTMKYFGAGEPEDYNSGRDADSIIEYMNTKAGTQRLKGGALKPTAGLVEELSVMTSAYLSAEPEARATLLEDAGKVVEGLEGAAKWSGDYYLRVMRNIAAKGAGYPAKEQARLEKMKAKSINDSKEDEFTRKIHILGAFLA
eukprot:gnl/Trimastix_PCT/421.p2 GENE.gnl/Trimastix_PCT/421~~gnl/Trimastix_PCT/421.p2  ORF type:complete len:365 (+),score=138.81 gnl/Trimastix_PCT/421:3-1097(+)